MNEKRIILFRGLPGSGKTTLSEALCKYTFSADQFFEEDGEYKFDATKLGAAHEWCQWAANTCMNQGLSPIGVANTFTTEKEMEPYFIMAKNKGYEISTVIMENRHGSVNVHNVPEETLVKMKNRFNIKL